MLGIFRRKKKEKISCGNKNDVIDKNIIRQ